MGWLKSKFKKVRRAAKKTLAPVRKAGRFVDVTSTKSFGGAGRYIAPIARQAVGTSAAVLTGGLSVAAGEKGWLSRSTFGKKTTVAGFKTGAAIGSAIAAGKGVTAIAGSAVKGAATPPTTPAAPTSSAPAALGGAGKLVGPLAGAGLGFAVGGPVGAVVGGFAGSVISKKK